MKERIKVAAVSYLNTKPLIHGFLQEPFNAEIDLNIHYPSIVAQQLIEGSVDIGLVPVAAIPQIPDAHIISDYCIGGVGKVASVCIFSEVPMEEIQEIYLDYQSRTSVRLAEILLREYWQKDIPLLPADVDYIRQVKGNKAGVIIGDRALQLLDKYPYIYDLSEYWEKHTGLPFVFAAWVSNKVLPYTFVEQFNQANELGFQHLDEVIKEHFITYYDLNKYYTRDISYRLDHLKKQGLCLFLSKLNPSFKLQFNDEFQN